MEKKTDKIENKNFNKSRISFIQEELDKKPTKNLKGYQNLVEVRFRIIF